MASRTRVKTLHPATQADNARFFDDPADVSRHAITMGIGKILEVERLLLLATGEAKAAAVVAAIEGSVSAPVPPSALQLHASALRHRDYYDEVARHRSDWQRPR